VVDLDLKQFFDEVDHDVLMSRLGQKVKDKRLKRLINGFLKVGVFFEGACHPTEKGTPRGGPLSPLLSNVLLDDLDKELERRRCSFCRYADGVNIYVATSRAGERVMQAVTHEQTVPRLCGHQLQGQGDQVPEATLRHGVLIRKQAGIRIQTDRRPHGHRRGDHRRRHLSRRPRRYRFLEENPHMPALAGSGTFQRGVKTVTAADTHKCNRVFLPQRFTGPPARHE
jgi:hypothetical protein